LPERPLKVTQPLTLVLKAISGPGSDIPGESCNHQCRPSGALSLNIFQLQSIQWLRRNYQSGVQRPRGCCHL